jgi:gas vesicle protein
MLMSDDNRNSFLWFFAGLGVGAVAATLYVPHSGVETRKALRSKAEQSRDRLRHHANRLREQASDLADRGRDFLNQRKDQAKEELAPKAVDAITDSAGRAAKVTADAVSHIRDAAKKAV